MNNHPFHYFIELVDFDQAVHTLIHRQKEVAQETMLLEQQAIEQEKQYAKTERALIDARKAVDALELEMKELVLQEKNKKKKLDTITHYKESSVLQREIDHVRSQQHALEDSLLQAWHTLETCERIKNEHYKKYQDQTQYTQHALEQKQREKADIEAQLATHEAEREQKKHHIPEEWLHKYEAMRLRVTDPIVPVENNACSACFHELSHQEIMRLAHGALLECKLCFRFLYNKNILQASRSL